MLAYSQTIKLENHRLSAVRSQLPSISRGRLLYQQPEGAQYRGVRSLHNMEYYY